ncbi:MAG: K+/H+ antiporter subunit F [Sphingomonadales bacterium]
MIEHAVIFAAGCFSLALLMNLWRLVRGPLVTDRVLALDTMTINAIALIVLAGIRWGTTIYFEAALMFAMVGFVTTVAYCRYLLRGDVIE